MTPVRSLAHRAAATLALASLLLLAACGASKPSDTPESALEGWKPGPARSTLVAFVQAVTTPGPDYVAPADRIAVFDNDGTLWSEQPVYFQVQFALDEVRRMAPEHPAWTTQEPFRSVLAGDMAGVARSGEKGLMQIVGVTHSGMSTEVFTQRVQHWTASARHPRTGQPYTQMTYAPMHALLDYLRAHQFQTYIVSGGDTDFMRAWTQQAYGIPPQQVIGSHFGLAYSVENGVPTLTRQPRLDFNDDGPGKPVAIQRHIGKRPILAFGNSDGDLEMLQWTMGGSGKRLAALVHHTDAAREWAYDRESKIGRLDKALDLARQQGWLVVDMQEAWSRVYAFEQQ